MTRDQTAEALTVVGMLWPHSNLGNDSRQVVDLWHSFLAGHDSAEVEAAIRELAAQGREHAPPVGVVVATVAERGTDCPDWDQVLREIRGTMGYRPPAGEGDPYAPPPAEHWSHPLIAAFMDGTWDEWRRSREGDGTFLAQQREAWKALAARARRGAALTAVGAPRRRDLHKPDFAAMLPKPKKKAACTATRRSASAEGRSS